MKEEILHLFNKLCLESLQLTKDGIHPKTKNKLNDSIQIFYSIIYEMYYIF